MTMNVKEYVRAFIAIELPEEIKTKLAILENQLKSGCSYVKWVDPENIHLTLKFLGKTPVNVIPHISSALDIISCNNQTFLLRIGELGAFPNRQNVQVIWVGVEGDLSSLKDFQNKIEKAISPLGFPTEKRPFTPHLTLARARESVSLNERKCLGELLNKVSQNLCLSMTVGGVSLKQSQLTPGGPIYSNLHTSKFATSCA